jgi:hypothetical protein
MIALHALERSCERALPGVKSLALIDPDDLTAQPTWYLQPNIAALSFKPGKAAYAFEADLLSARLVGDPDTGSQSGDFHNYRLTANVRTLVGTVDYLRAKLMNRRTHVVVTYRNGSQRFVPNMRLSATDDSGSRGNGQNGYTFNGAARLLGPAPWLAGEFDVIGGPIESGGELTPGAVNLVEISTSASTYTYAIPAGYLLSAWELTGSDAQTVSLGSTALGDELGGPVDLTALQTWVGTGNVLPSTGYNIYFSGLTGSNTIKLWLLG